MVQNLVVWLKWFLRSISTMRIPALHGRGEWMKNKIDWFGDSYQKEPRKRPQKKSLLSTIGWTITLKNAWTTSRWVNFLWVANFNLKFGVLHQIHCFLFQFDSSLFFIMQILINIWYVCVNSEYSSYFLQTSTTNNPYTSYSQFKATMDWLSLCQWLFKRKYHLLFSCTYFVLSQNPYTKQLFLDSVHSPYIEQKQQAVSHTFQHLFKKTSSHLWGKLVVCWFFSFHIANLIYGSYPLSFSFSHRWIRLFFKDCWTSIIRWLDEPRNCNMRLRLVRS